PAKSPSPGTTPAWTWTRQPPRRRRGTPARSRSTLRPRLVHDRPPGQHDPEDEEHGHRARIHNDLDEEHELTQEEKIDRADRHEGHREPERRADHPLVDDDQDRADDLERAQYEERDELPVNVHHVPPSR